MHLRYFILPFPFPGIRKMPTFAVKIRYRYSALVIKTKRTIWVKKEEYKLKNEQFLQNLRTEEGVKELAAGVLYRILESGQGSSATPRPNSIVSVHYKGTLINGREFDNSWKRNCPEAFRLNEVIDGWQIALQQMRVGDHWMVYIPYTVGYGTRTSGPIPAFSTLIFEVKLLGIA